MKTTSRHMLRWKIAIQEYRGNMKIIYNKGESHNTAYGLSRWPLENDNGNSANGPEVASKICTHFMKIDKKKNLRLSECAPGSGTPDTDHSEPEETETPILGMGSS
ncbi:hypothetical protein O181_089300 [Austropuccinia psidii MF-1]|uniref:Uncharacterized protein n=1 Tax=Austropuccinia psidii MF-1 TaxID=1389203 RepID=A0A9Q3IT04_9BASI|nr:hypothetical protein [Austropuccinia psidii MF-1]